MAERTLSIIRIATGVVTAHMTLVCGFVAYSAIMTKGNYLGVSAQSVPGAAKTIIGHFLLHATTGGLVVSVIIGFLLGLPFHHRWTGHEKITLVKVGAWSYCLLSLTLYLIAPGAISYLPLVSTVSIGASLVICGLLISLIGVLLVRILGKMQGLYVMAVVIALPFAPP